VLSVMDVLDHPQVTSRGLVHDFDAVPGLDRPVRVVRSGFRLQSGDPQPSGPPPRLGEHTAEILAELGFRDSEIAALSAEKAV
jgi:formyl-CoA transferase